MTKDFSILHFKLQGMFQLQFYTVINSSTFKYILRFNELIPAFSTDFMIQRTNVCELRL